MLETLFRFPCGLSVPNRIVKAAMTEKLAGVDGRPTARHARLFRRFADGGAGLLLTGNVLVDSRYLEAPGNVFVEDQDSIDVLRVWAAAGRSSGGAIIMQINHAGRQTPRMVAAESVAPSATPLSIGTFFSRPRAMTTAEIEEAIARFGYVARVAEKTGFSGVQVHAAHGYLASQFLSPRVNKRTDAWGGSIENRARFLVRVLEAIRCNVSAGFAVGVKLNVADFVKGGLESEDSVRTVQMLNPLGIDFLELSGGTHEGQVAFKFNDGAMPPEQAYFRECARAIRRATDMPIILTGGMRRRPAMEALLAGNACDLIGIARPLAIEPDLPRRLLRDENEAAREVTLKLPTPPRANLAELLWCRAQLLRLSKGKAPKLSLSPKLALLRMMLADRGFAKRRARHVRRRNGKTADAAKSGSTLMLPEMTRP